MRRVIDMERSLSSSSSSSSSSSCNSRRCGLVFNRRGRSKREIKKTKLYELKLHDGGRFCEVEAATFVRRDGAKHIHHYVYDVHNTDALDDLKLRKLDELLQVNGQGLQNQKYRHVKRLFRSIKPAKDGTIYMTLVLRRWEKEDEDGEEIWVTYDDITLTLNLSLDHSMTSCSRASSYIERRLGINQTERYNVRFAGESVAMHSLPPGNIDTVRLQPPVLEDRLQIFNTSKYVQYDDSGHIQAKVLDDPDQGFLMFERYNGYDTSPDPPVEFIFGCRFYYKDGPRRWYLQINRDKCHRFTLGFREGLADDVCTNIDQRCFIYYKDVQFIFQSQIYRDKFIQYDKSTDMFSLCTMEPSSITCLVRKHHCPECGEAYRKFAKCRFMLYRRST